MEALDLAMELLYLAFLNLPWTKCRPLLQSVLEHGRNKVSRGRHVQLWTHGTSRRRSRQRKTGSISKPLSNSTLWKQDVTEYRLSCQAWAVTCVFLEGWASPVVGADWVLSSRVTMPCSSPSPGANWRQQWARHGSVLGDASGEMAGEGGAVCKSWSQIRNTAQLWGWDCLAAAATVPVHGCARLWKLLEASVQILKDAV